MSQATNAEPPSENWIITGRFSSCTLARLRRLQLLSPANPFKSSHGKHAYKLVHIYIYIYIKTHGRIFSQRSAVNHKNRQGKIARWSFSRPKPPWLDLSKVKGAQFSQLSPNQREEKTPLAPLEAFRLAETFKLGLFFRKKWQRKTPLPSALGWEGWG